MKLIRHPKNPLLEKNPFHCWEAGSVLNPNVIYDKGIFKMVYRATNNVKVRKNGEYVSSIGYAESKDGFNFTRFQEPLIFPDQEYESRLGCEDPRVTKINNLYLLYYTAVGGIKNQHIRVALATSKDFKTFIKHGIVGPLGTNTKAATLFPEKIEGKYIVLYTLESNSSGSSIMQARFNTLEDVIKPSPSFMTSNLNHYNENAIFKFRLNVHRGAEVGAAPIKTDFGWLLIYCGVNITPLKEWTINAALLDLKNPRRILSEAEEPLLRPGTPSELKGVVNNVTFPSGALVIKEDLYVYYGSGDQGCCLGTCNFNKLVDYLKSRINPH